MKIKEAKMKIEIEIPDLEEYFFPGYDEEDGGYITNKEISEKIISLAIERCIDRMYDDYVCDNVYSTIKNDAKEVVKNHSKEIINTVIDRVSDEILRKKAIMDEIPKKSEVAYINKEWESYFIELIDKAIAKRFK